jgi:hypothetical protein
MNSKDEGANVTNNIWSSTCPACGYHVAVPFFDGGMQPLATIAWPTDSKSAQDLPKLPLNFVRCVDCGHVYNATFDYQKIPYSDKPNLMFNQGANWSGFIRNLRSKILQRLPADPVVVEIGHGDGSFLAALAEGQSSGQFIGFDPHGATKAYGAVRLRAELFEPSHHLRELGPDIIITRHVLEHLVNPLGFLQQISFIARSMGIAPLAYFEVPCIDRVFETGRTADFYYEHSSQFTTESFARMLSQCAAEIVEIGHGYDGEVVFGFLRMGNRPDQIIHAQQAQTFLQGANAALQTICEQLDMLCIQQKRVVVWGGTGKAAAFMQRYGMDAARFPNVIDDDINKVNTYVPGTGQRIHYRDWLLQNPVDVIIIPTQWRAADILAVMSRENINAEAVLIEHNRRLIDFRKDNHPYKASSN